MQGTLKRYWVVGILRHDPKRLNYCTYTGTYETEQNCNHNEPSGGYQTNEPSEKLPFNDKGVWYSQNNMENYKEPFHSFLLAFNLV